MYGFCKVHICMYIFWEGHKILRNLHLTFDYSLYIQSKVRWRFRKILCPSQNIWTLKASCLKRNRNMLICSYRIFLTHCVCETCRQRKNVSMVKTKVRSIFDSFWGLNQQWISIFVKDQACIILSMLSIGH